jgi:hypothetical protein
LMLCWNDSCSLEMIGIYPECMSKGNWWEGKYFESRLSEVIFAQHILVYKLLALETT